MNLAPGFKCTGCPYGFDGSAPAGVGIEEAKQEKQVCKDINECKSDENHCDKNAQCINTLV